MKKSYDHRPRAADRAAALADVARAADRAAAAAERAANITERACVITSEFAGGEVDAYELWMELKQEDLDKATYYASLAEQSAADAADIIAEAEAETDIDKRYDALSRAMDAAAEAARQAFFARITVAEAATFAKILSRK